MCRDPGWLSSRMAYLRVSQWSRQTHSGWQIFGAPLPPDTGGQSAGAVPAWLENSLMTSLLDPPQCGNTMPWITLLVMQSPCQSTISPESMRGLSSSPRKSVRLTSTVRRLRCFLMTCPISRRGQTCKQHRPFPAVVFTGSRKARTIALGYAAHPSTQTST